MRDGKADSAGPDPESDSSPLPFREACAAWLEASLPELRRLAAQYNRRFRPHHTLEGDALVNQAHAVLSERNHRDPIPVEHAGHLVAMHALAMLNVLRGYEAARNAGKRDGQRHREALRESMQLTGGRALSWVDLVDLLERLERRNRSDALLVLLKVFNECTDAEIATALGRSLTSIRRDWRSVRAVVRVMLEESRSP